MADVELRHLGTQSPLANRAREIAVEAARDPTKQESVLRNADTA